MKTIDYTQLLRIAGTFEGIISAATSRAHNIDDVQNAERWAHAAVIFGLAAGGTRADAVAMRRLVTAGLLESAGQTQGRAYKLTVRGWFTASSWLGCTPEALRVLLQRVSTLQAKSRVTLPADPKTRLCMMWGLVPCCGQWLSGLKTAAAVEQFKTEVCEVEGRLVPLLALGWVNRYVSTSGAFWALTITDAGKAALNDWPTFETPRDIPSADSDSVFEAWQQGYEKGKALVRTTPPDIVKNVVARLTPATAWM
jgi:hypothetical protein